MYHCSLDFMFGKDFRVMLERRIAVKTLSRGKKSLICRTGILGFGLPSFLITAVADYYGWLGGHRFPYPNAQIFLIREAVMFAVCLLSGLSFSLRLWKHYNKIVQHDATL